MTGPMSVDQQAIMTPSALVSGPFKRPPAVVTNEKCIMAPFIRARPGFLTRPATASDSDIYISANDVSETHFHIYAYKYTARTGTGGRPGHVNWTEQRLTTAPGIGSDD